MDFSREELVSQINNSTDQKFYLITSPICEHERKSLLSFSDVSSGSSKNSSLLSCYENIGCNTTAVTGRSRINLERQKRILLDQILVVEEELKILNNEEIQLKNLQTVLKSHCEKIYTFEKNKQPLISIDQIREMLQCFHDKLASIATDIESFHSLPYTEELEANIKEVKKYLSLILKKKSAPEMLTLLEMLCSIGELTGNIDIILSLFYQHIETEPLKREKSQMSEPSPIKPTMELIESSKSPLNSTADSFDGVVIPSRQKILSKPANSRNPLKTLRYVIKSCTSLSVLIKGTERLSSGNPKMKSLKSCLSKARESIDKICEQEFDFLASSDMLRKLNKVKILTQTDKPTQGSLEEVLLVLNEVIGHTKILLKNHLKNKADTTSELFPERTATI